ncbi:MAG: hypothetical protein EBS06_09200, partial [Proteobacteria bacterium]|nr:hypothetical protein [Pseudomonadota bacterium]
SVSNIYATINNLNSTGSNLNDKINSLSGALNSSGTNLNNSIIFLSGLFTGFTGNLDASYATDIQLQNTGSTLNENINNLSGTLTNNYYLKSNPSGFITGVDLSSYITSSTASLTYATISNLALTGSTLNFEINSLSGTLTSTYATISNLATTGSTLINNINSLSGTLTGDYVTKSNGQFNNRPTVNGTGVLLSGEVAALPATIVYTTGNQTISGDKNFVENIIIGDATQENLFVISGNEISFGVIPTVSGNPLLTGINLTAYITTGQTGSFYPNSNPSGFITGIDLSNYATINNLELTGSTLNYNINSLSGSAVLLYGDQSVGGIKTFRDKVYINNLYVTGTETILNTTNNNIASPYLLLNLTGGLTDGGIFFVTGIGLTGTNDSGVIFGFDNITKSWHFGQGTRLTDISTLDEVMGYHDLSGYSGYVNNTFSTITNLASTGSTLQTNINTVSSNLANTGSTLDSKIGSLSGTLTSNYATISNLASTGSTLNSNIDSLSGTLTSNYATITNLASTGSTLQTNINNLSGYINSSNSNIVFTTGNQTINGLKTFNSGVVINVQPTGTNPALYITGTWNDANIPYSGLVIDITDTNSKVTNTVGDTSYLLELKKNNTSQIALTHKTNYSTSIPSIHNTASSLNIGRTNSTLYFGATQGGNAHAILSNNAFTVRNATAIGWSAASAGSDIGSQD